MMFGGNFAPRGWTLCDGQLLLIAQNAALFSIQGTTCGGNRQSTFALPDLRGRAPVHAGLGPGLSPYKPRGGDRVRERDAGREPVGISYPSVFGARQQQTAEFDCNRSRGRISRRRGREPHDLFPHRRWNHGGRQYRSECGRSAGACGAARVVRELRHCAAGHFPSRN